MTDQDISGFFMMIIGIVALVFGLYLGFGAGKESIKEEAVQQGVAEHNSKTGEWQWKNDIDYKEK